MLNNSLVSIIVPNYNHEKFLKQRLESIFNQTYANFEVILLDDCSTDNSREIILEYAKNAKVSQCVFNEINSGNTFQQWAKGISLAKGEFIWIAESDDYCNLNFLEVVIQPLLKEKEVVMAYCQSNRINGFSEITGNWISHTEEFNTTLFNDSFVIDSNEFIERFLICKNVIPNASAALIKKEAIDLQLHFDFAPEFRYCGDWMFYFKLIINKKVAFISESLNNFRFHSKSVIAKANQSEQRIAIIDIDINMRKEMISFLKKHKVLNFNKIYCNNKLIKRKYLYEKVVLLIRNENKVKGYILLLSVLDVFYKEYKIRKNLIIKLKRFLKIV